MARMLSGCLIGKCTRSNSFERAADIQVTSWGRQGQRRQEGPASVCTCKCNKFGSREQKTCYAERRGCKLASRLNPADFCPFVRRQARRVLAQAVAQGLNSAAAPAFCLARKSAGRALLHRVLHHPPAPALLGRRCLSFSSLSLGFRHGGDLQCLGEQLPGPYVRPAPCASLGMLSRCPLWSGCYPRGTGARRWL